MITVSKQSPHTTHTTSHTPHPNPRPHPHPAVHSSAARTYYYLPHPVSLHQFGPGPASLGNYLFYLCPHLDIQQHLVNAYTPPVSNPANQFRLPHIQQVSRLNPVITRIEHHQVIEVEGVKVGVIHKDQMTSDHAEGLRYLAKEMDVDVLIFGHFHHPIIEEFKVLLLSPGSAIVPGIAEPSAIEQNIFEGRIRGKVIRCDGNVCGYFEYGVK